jgi:hypothetical protein
MEVLLHSGAIVSSWRIHDLHQTVLKTPLFLNSCPKNWIQLHYMV